MFLQIIFEKDKDDGFNIVGYLESIYIIDFLRIRLVLRKNKNMLHGRLKTI
jgi:hypothetical protein